MMLTMKQRQAVTSVTERQYKKAMQQMFGSLLYHFIIIEPGLNTFADASADRRLLCVSAQPRSRDSADLE